MGSNDSAITYEFPGMIRVYRDGRIERLTCTDVLPAGKDPQTGVVSKDVTIIPNSGVSARLYLPDLAHSPTQKLPLVVYFHGGGYCVSTPATSYYHNYVNKLVAEARVVAVSVDYRRAPEHPLPVAYEDSWAALQWAASHCNGGGPESWLNDHADFGRVFLSGLSAGANIVHNLAMGAGSADSGSGVDILGMDILGVGLEHPYFWGSAPIGSESLDPVGKGTLDRLWPFVCPSSPGNDDPWINPVAEGAPCLAGLGCRRVLVCVAEKDFLRDRGWLYFQELRRCGWMGVVEIHETEGEDHAFHLYDSECEKAKDLIGRLAAFFNGRMPPLV